MFITVLVLEELLVVVVKRGREREGERDLNRTDRERERGREIKEVEKCFWAKQEQITCLPLSLAL